MGKVCCNYSSVSIRSLSKHDGDDLDGTAWEMNFYRHFLSRRVIQSFLTFDSMYRTLKCDHFMGIVGIGSKETGAASVGN